MGLQRFYVHVYLVLTPSAALCSCVCLVRYRTYEVLKEETANPRVKWAYLPYSMHMAGPREVSKLTQRLSYSCGGTSSRKGGCLGTSRSFSTLLTLFNKRSLAPGGALSS